MWTKKFVTASVAGMMAAMLVAFPASAHGDRRQAVAVDTSCPVCTVEGCTETGRHYHDDHEYCGYGHSSGYCDHSCETVSSYSSCHRGHHGCY